MFEVKIDGIDALTAKISKMADQITALQHTMPQELESWQREDMKRKYPNMQVDTANSETVATTYIWPRSRQPSKNKPRFQGPRQHLPVKRGPVVRSNRPILRAELLQKLHDRMLTLVKEAAKWP
jgi:hypothetical protein